MGCAMGKAWRHQVEPSVCTRLLMVRFICLNGGKRSGPHSSGLRRDQTRHPSNNAAIASCDRGVEPGIRVTPKIVATWRKRETVEDHKTGPKTPRPGVLSEVEDAMIAALSCRSTAASMPCS